MKEPLSKKKAALFVIREKLALDLSNEIFMDKNEAYELIDFSVEDIEAAKEVLAGYVEGRTFVEMYNIPGATPVVEQTPGQDTIPAGGDKDAIYKLLYHTYELFSTYFDIRVSEHLNRVLYDCPLSSVHFIFQ